jgi:hypothetical protein
MLPPKLWLSNKRKRPMFRLSVVSHEPPGHTPPAFLFLSSTMSKSGEDFIPPTYSTDKKFSWPPFGRYQLHSLAALDASRSVALSSSARPFSDGGYMRRQVRVSSALS